LLYSSDLFDPISIRIAIPITSWQEKFNVRPFMVQIVASLDNGLDRESAGNVLQVRGLSTDRFVKRLGRVSDEVLQELLYGLIICTDYEPKS
jgi:mRNA interferase MazF